MGKTPYELLVEELEEVVSDVLSGKRYFGKQVLLAMDGKVLRGIVDEDQNVAVFKQIAARQ